MDATASAVSIEILNPGETSVFLDGSWNYDCGAPYFKLRDADNSEVILDRLPFLACNCDRCDSAACQGLVDSGPAFLEIPGEGSVTIHWAGLAYQGNTDVCDRGCYEGVPAGDGPFVVEVSYSRTMLHCPEGEPSPAEISGPEGDGMLRSCPHADLRCFAGTTALPLTTEATFRASDETIRVALP